MDSSRDFPLLFLGRHRCCGRSSTYCCWLRSARGSLGSSNFIRTIKIILNTKICKHSRQLLPRALSTVSLSLSVPWQHLTIYLHSWAIIDSQYVFLPPDAFGINHPSSVALEEHRVLLLLRQQMAHKSLVKEEVPLHGLRDNLRHALLLKLDKRVALGLGILL